MAQPRPAFICARCARSLNRSSKTRPSFRSLSSPAKPAEWDTRYLKENQTPAATYKHTPERMRMAFRVRPMPDQEEWKHNETITLKGIDGALDRMIGDAGGRGVKGSSLLSEEVKWLTMTHKSFEQGARGYNEKLAFLGRRLVELETSKALLAAPQTPIPPLDEKINDADIIGPTVKYEALDGIENVTEIAKQTILSQGRVAGIAQRYGLDQVIRWHPNQRDSLVKSGSGAVYASAVYAVVGALSLQKGGHIASEVVRNNILAPLGLRPVR